MNGSQEKTTTLRTEPSFCIYSEEDDHNNKSTNNEDLIKKNLVENSSKILETQFSFGKNSLQSISEDVDSPSRFQDLHHRNIITIVNDNSDPHNSFQTLIRQNPSNPLVLRNYAEFLESKGDLLGAEKYYFHATLADPKDAEILSQYAKLVWELHHDRRKVLSCFDRAIQAAPEDSHVRAAYASFLWEIDDDEEDDSLNTQAENAKNLEDENIPASPRLHLAMGLGINLIGYYSGSAYVNTDTNDISVVEEYYRRLVEENPFNPLYLSDYAHYLQQSKGDLHGAEDYYSRAILLDPSNGLVLSLYANLVWQLHGDKNRAISYFERAIQARPNDSEILGSYAKFLWEVDVDKEDLDEETSSRTST